MKKGIKRIRWAGILGLAAGLVILVSGLVTSDTGGTNTPRPDVLIIDTLKHLSGCDVERPGVVFLHDLHTEALAKQNKDCSACHLKDTEYEVIPATLKTALKRIDPLSPKFNRLKDEGCTEVMNVYHDNCISCHKTMIDDGKKAGPVLCGGCHMDRPDIVSTRQIPSFDRSLHFRHSKAQENKCERCHHEYNAETKTLFYAKGKEGSCRYCHEKETVENRISMRLASHIACIRCHRALTEEKKSAGPIKCAGCHDPAVLKLVEKVEKVPRMERKQPDMTLVKVGISKPLDRQLIRMKSVPYDHKSHEQYNDTCMVCHHNSLDSCAKCHTIDGTKEGKGVKLDVAMHLNTSRQSCIGCHESFQQDKKCAGCHNLMEKGKVPEKTCAKCHTGPVELKPAEGQEAPDPAAVAKQLLDQRKPVRSTFPDEDIPEKIIMKELVNKYEPVEFPHRKIVKTLAKYAGESNMAAYFHTNEATICQGCHHNSPATKKPPRCTNCHGTPFDERKLNSPGIVGAYHQQCMGCHKAMELEKPAGCTGCHKERNI